mgnify:CR=1 FL=1
MAFDDDAAQAEQDGAVELAGVQFAFQAFQGGESGDGSHFVEQVALEFLTDGSAHEFDRAFDGFEHDVADKAVCDNHVGFAVQDAVAFDVADEIQFAAFEQFEGLFDGVRAFDVFGADVKQADARAAFLRVEGLEEFVADDGELYELFWRTIDV